MADLIGPFDGTPWAESEWYQFAGLWAPSGVVGAPAASMSSGAFGVSSSGLTATVATNGARAWVDGTGYKGDGNKAIAVPANTNTTQARRDRFVLRRSVAAKTCAVTRLEGTPSASPTALGLSQVSGAVYDVPICSFLVPADSGTTLSGFVDERPWVEPNGGGTAWTDLSLSGGYQTPGQPNFGGVAQFRRTGRKVELQGIIFRQSAVQLTDGSTIATLPSGSRPPVNRYFLCHGTDSGVVSLQVNTSGAVVVKAFIDAPGTAVTHWVSLDGIEFETGS